MQDLLTARIPRLNELISPELDEILSLSANSVRYKDGQTIYKRGDSILGFSIVRSGAIKFGNIGSDGSYLQTSIAAAGHCFGEFTLFSELPRTHDSIAVGDTVVDEIPAKRFLALFEEHTELSKILLIISLSRTHEVLEFFDDMRRLPLRIRVAKFLLERSSTLDIEVLQEDLAFTFGVSRVSMGNVLGQLEKIRLIKRGYSRISIEDIEGLSQWVAEQSKLEPLA